MEGADRFSRRVNRRGRFASQKVGSVAISLVIASRAELRRCACCASKALHTQTRTRVYVHVSTGDEVMHHEIAC